MARKLLFFLTVGLMLAAGLITTPSHASGLPGYYSSYWYRPRTVHVKYPVKVYQMNPENLRVKQKMVLLENSKIQVENTTTWGWVVKAPYLQKSSNTIWVVKGIYHQGWMKW